jgi:hypothetical protein
MGKGRDRRNDRRSSRRASRNERKAIKQDGKTQRALGRQDVRKTAYETGNDPNAFIKDIAKTVGKTVAGVAGIKGATSVANTAITENGQTKRSANTLAASPTGGGQSFFDWIKELLGMK